MASHIERLKFLATLGGAAAVWPLAARAQQGERMRLVGILAPISADTPTLKGTMRHFLKGSSSWVGRLGATCGSRCAGAKEMKLQYESTQRNSLRLLRTCLWPLAVPL